MAEYPISKFHFIVDWGGRQIGFTEVSGLTVEVDPIEYRHGASNEFTKIKMPGMVKYSNLTLKRGTFHGDDEFHTWWKTIEMNNVERRDITISILNSNHEAVISWSVKNAWPVKVDPGDLKADGNEVAIETLELAHEGITINHV